MKLESTFLAFCLAGASSAWATTYTLSGANYNPATRAGIYATATGITGSFTTASPLPANLANAPVASGTGGLGYVTSWSFNDGVFTYTEANSVVYVSGGTNFFQVSTNGSGAVTDFNIILVQPATGAVLHGPSEWVFIGPTSITGERPPDCLVLTAPGGACNGYSGNVPDTAFGTPSPSASFSASALPPPPPPAAGAPIPASSPWTLAALAAMVAGAGFAVSRRRRQA